MAKISKDCDISDSDSDILELYNCIDLFDNAKSIDEIKKLNLDFVEGKMYATNYHLGPLNTETKKIHKEIIKMNKLGFMTVCSQPGFIKGDDMQRGTVCGLIEKNKYEKFRKELFAICDNIYIKITNDNNIIELMKPYNKVPEWFTVTINNGYPYTHISLNNEPCESFKKCNIYPDLVEKYHEIEIIDMKWGRKKYIHEKVVKVLEMLK